MNIYSTPPLCQSLLFPELCQVRGGKGLRDHEHFVQGFGEVWGSASLAGPSFYHGLGGQQRHELGTHGEVHPHPPPLRLWAFTRHGVASLLPTTIQRAALTQMRREDGKMSEASNARDTGSAQGPG